MDGQPGRGRRHDPAIEAVIELLVELYPKAFSIYEGRRKPLKVGIRDDLLEALGGAVTEAELQTALRCYTANRVYQSRLREGAVRIDLQGEPCGTVSANDAGPAPVRNAQGRARLMQAGKW